MNDQVGISGRAVSRGPKGTTTRDRVAEPDLALEIHRAFACALRMAEFRRHAARVHDLHREAIIRRGRGKWPHIDSPPTEAEMEHGVPLLLESLADALRLGESGGTEISNTTGVHRLTSRPRLR